MPLRVQCHYCRNTINIADHLRGRTIRCPYCQRATKVPGPQPAAHRPQQMPAQRMASFPAPPPPRRPPAPAAPPPPMLPQRPTRMPPPQTHFEGVDIPDHVYQEPMVDEPLEQAAPLEPQRQPVEEYYGDEMLDAAQAGPMNDYGEGDDDIPMPLRSRKKKSSSAMMWLAILLALVVVGGGAAAAIWYLNNQGLL